MGSRRQCCLVAVLMFSAGVPLSGQPNHLVPINSEYPEYRRLIYKALLVTPAQFGRMIYEPGFYDPEWALSVWQTERRIGSSESGSYHITVTRSSSSIWISLQSKNEENKQQPIRVSRKDATIDRELAVAVQRAWSTMLSRTRPDKNEYLFTDPPTVEFSLEAKRAEITPPRRGLTGEMYEIGTALAKLCDTPPAHYAAKRDELLRRLAAFERKARGA
jgi:hypothetical protein